MGMGDFWPLLGLRIHAPNGLELRYVGDGELAALAALARDGVHDPSQMPFTQPWTDTSPEGRALATVQWHWRNRAGWRPDDWRCPFAVVVDGEVVGVQELFADDFGVTREVRTGSWLGLAHHGRGIGTRMRTAALAFLFDHLGAATAVSDAWEDNAASLGVSRKLGYRDDGIEYGSRRGRRVMTRRVRLDAEDWRARDRPTVRVDGLERCRAWFDATVPGWLGADVASSV
jgi:RimJ/RimL family protein N-acetyltransferase